MTCGVRSIPAEVFALLAPKDRPTFPPCQREAGHRGLHDWQRPDALVHQLTSMTQERGSRFVAVKCGAMLPPLTSHEPLQGVSAWWSEVNCPACHAVHDDWHANKKDLFAHA